MWERAQGAAGAGCVPSVCTLSSRLPLATQAEPWRASAYSEKSEPQCVQCAQCGQGHWLHCIHCAHWEPNHQGGAESKQKGEGGPETDLPSETGPDTQKRGLNPRVQT